MEIKQMNDWEKSKYADVLIHKNISEWKILKSIYSKLPNKVYRYRSLSGEYELDNLKNNQIWLAKPDTFNDPFDSMINADIGEMFKRYKFQDKEMNNLYHRMDGVQKRAANRIVEKEGKKIQLEIDNDIKKFRDNFSVACFSESNANLLMWSHYANYHKGICIEYSFNDINNKDDNVSFLPVIYTSQFQNMIDYIDIKKNTVSDQIVKLFLMKSMDWNYEKEWRIVKEISEENNDKLGELYSVPKPTAIYLGCKVNVCDAELIRKTCKSNTIPVFQMKMSRNKYKLEY